LFWWNLSQTPRICANKRFLPPSWLGPCDRHQNFAIKAQQTNRAARPTHSRRRTKTTLDPRKSTAPAAHRRDDSEGNSCQPEEGASAGSNRGGIGVEVGASRRRQVQAAHRPIASMFVQEGRKDGWVPWTLVSVGAMQNVFGGGMMMDSAPPSFPPIGPNIFFADPPTPQNLFLQKQTPNLFCHFNFGCEFKREYLQNINFEPSHEISNVLNRISMEESLFIPQYFW
jgi:hypothetical protein